MSLQTPGGPLGTRVLVVDVHGICAFGVRTLLVDEGFSVVACVQSPVAALQILRATSVDVVVLDVVMPGNEGVDLLLSLPEVSPGTAAVVYSSLPSRISARPLVRMGASAYVEKKGSLKALVDEVRHAAQSRCPSMVAVSDKASASKQVTKAGEFFADSEPDFSSREFQVLLRLASGDTVGHIAGVLGVSGVTISCYRARILKKLALRTNAQLTYFALRAGLMAR